MSIIARDKLSGLIFNKIVTFKNISYDNININKWMLDNNLALSYDGGMTYLINIGKLIMMKIINCN